MNWHDLIDEATVQPLLSAGYERFARPISEALVVFLSGLPLSAQQEILAAQAALPGASSAAERVRRLALQCPVLHKLGQALARDRRLDPALRCKLRTLESLPPAVPLQTIRAALDRELGSLDRLGIRLDTRAIAEASVAVVIGYQDERGSGVFKVLKPGIEARLALELALLQRVGTFLDERCDALGIPKIGYEGVFRRVKEKLQDEVRLDVEQRHLTLAADQYADFGRVQVPGLHAYCTARVTAMERVTGRKISEHGHSDLRNRRAIAQLLASTLLSRPLFSTHAQALFHGDPHAGNLLLAPDGRLVLIDWSLAGILLQRDREAMVHAVLGAMLRDERLVVEMLTRLCEGAPADQAALRAVVREGLDRLGYAGLPGFSWLVQLLDTAVERAGLTARADLLLFRKALHTLNDLVLDIGEAEESIDVALFSDFAQKLIAEWPLRWLAAPDSRAFATRLSNLDLAGLMLQYPLLTTRFWTGVL
jgi:ubiquinone biosynthesis protein